MIELLKYITETLQGIHPDTYYDYNLADNVSYPYITFDVDTESVERHRDVVTLDLDIFDYSTADTGPGYEKIFTLESELKDALSWRRDLTDDINAMWSFIRSTNVPTSDKSLTRRNLQFQIKIDWRNK